MLLFRVYVCYQCQELLDAAQRLLASHQRRVEGCLETDLTNKDVTELNVYSDALRAVPDQAGFPYQVQWPERPFALRRHVVT